MTGQDLAERAGVSASYISLIEKGVRIPSEEAAQAIARALNDDPELYRVWVQSDRIGDLESAWARLHRARSYASSPAFRQRLRSGQDLDVDEVGRQEAERGFAPEKSAEASERPAFLRRMADAFVAESQGTVAQERAVEDRLRAAHDLVAVPVLHECADPGEGAIPPRVIVDVLRVDRRVFGSAEPRRPFAYRVQDRSIRRVQDLFRPGDWVVLDSRPRALTADRVHAVRLRGKVVLSRILAKGDALLLLPTEGRSDVEVLDRSPGEPIGRLVVGSVVVSIRGESPPVEDDGPVPYDDAPARHRPNFLSPGVYVEEGATEDAAVEVEVTDPAILIRINRLFEPGMSDTEMYEATRGIWKLGDRRNGARLALAVFRGIVREVFEIDDWHPAGETRYETRTFRESDLIGRWEFTGRRAPEEIRLRYVGRSVRAYFQQGAQNPVTYVRC